MLGTLSFCGAVVASMAPTGAATQLLATAAGAVGDGVTLNTRAINAAIDRLSGLGGGTLVFPPGRFLTGTVYLKSRVTVRLDRGAILLGAKVLDDYPENMPPHPSNNLEFGRYSLIYAASQHDVGVVGEGIVDGQGDSESFNERALIARGWSKRDAYLKRPFGLCFTQCRNVLVKDVTLKNSGFWMQDYLDCDHVRIEHIHVDNMKDDWNNDGIDVDGSRDVTVKDSSISAGDDGICLKSSFSTCKAVRIWNCWIHSHCNGIKLGTASRGGFRDVGVYGCVIDQTRLAGIALEVVDGGTLDGVSFQKIGMNGVGTPIFIRLGNAGRKWLAEQPKVGPGSLRNVRITDVDAIVDPRLGGSQYASSITGLPGHEVQNVTIQNVKVRRLEGKLARFIPPERVPDPEKAYPEYSMFGPLPAYGFFCRHVRGLHFDNVTLSYTGLEERPPMVYEDVVDLDEIRLSAMQPSQP